MENAPVPAASAIAENGQYLTFMLGRETYSIGILSIKEIIEYGTVTTVPMMPSFVRGVINLRGSVVPVLDLLARFGMGRTEARRRTCIVIVEVRHGEEIMEVGILVDAVNEVIGIARADIEPPPSFGSRIDTRLIAGMGKVGGRFVVILDVDRVADCADIAASLLGDSPALALAA